MKKSFLVCAEDAVAIAGSPAVDQLAVTMTDLLQLCAGQSIEAKAVLEQTTRPNALEGVDVNTLLDTGLRANQLHALGYSSIGLAQTLDGGACAGVQLSKFGFKI